MLDSIMQIRPGDEHILKSLRSVSCSGGRMVAMTFQPLCATCLAAVHQDQSRFL